MPNVKTTGWTYLGDAASGQAFLIEGVDVWRFEWQRLSNPEFVISDTMVKTSFCIPIG